MATNEHQEAVDLLMAVAAVLKPSDPVAAKEIVALIARLLKGKASGTQAD